MVWLKRLFLRWIEHENSKSAAAIAFYTLFSMAPLLVIGEVVAGMAFGQEEVRQRIVEQVRFLAGSESAQAVQTLLENISGSLGSGGGWTSIAVGVFMVWGATRVFSELRGAMNRIWDAKTGSGRRALSHALRGKALAFGLVLLVGILLVLSLTASLLISSVSAWLESFLGVPSFWIQLANNGFSLVLWSGLVAVILKYLPAVDIRWRDMGLGAVTASALLLVAKLLLGLYFERSLLALSYDAASAVVLLLIWVFVSVQILLLGAETTRLTVEKKGRMQDET